MDIQTTVAMERFMKAHDEVCMVEHFDDTKGGMFRIIMMDGGEGEARTLESALDKARFS